MSGMRAPVVMLLLSLLACGATPADSAGLISGEESGLGSSAPTTIDVTPTSGAGDPTLGTGTSAAATTAATTEHGPDSTAGPGDSSSTGDPAEPPPICGPVMSSGGEGAPLDYGFATVPPTMALVDTFYGHDLRTNIGACATDRVQWTLVSAPTAARLELPGVVKALAPGETHVHEAGGAAREQAKSHGTSRARRRAALIS